MKVAVVGTGSIGRRHLRNLGALGHDPIAVSTRRTDSILSLGDSEVRCVRSLGEAIRQGADAVFVANPTSMHVATAAEAIGAGLHVYLEKPAAITVAACEDLIALAEHSGVVVSVGQQFRFHPLVERFREIVVSGRLGLLLAVQANFGEHLGDYHPEEDYRVSYAARKELGGGVLLTQIHLIDLLGWLVGPMYSVFALGGHRTDLEVDVEDSVSFLAKAVGGTPVYGHLDYRQRPKHAQLSVTGTTGRVHLDLVSDTLVLTGAAAKGDVGFVNAPTKRNQLFVAAADDFFSSVQEGTAVRCGLDDAAKTLHLVGAIKESMHSGSVIDLDMTGSETAGTYHG